MTKITTQTKRKNLARRDRLNKDWPIKVYNYDCWPVEKPPQALWDTAHEMRRLWNEFTAIFRKIVEDDKKDDAGKPILPKEERAILWAPLNTKPLREIAKLRKDKLDSGCREAVVVRFLTTIANWRKNPQQFGPPRFQRADEMNSICIPLVYNDGKSADWVTSGLGTSGVRYTRDMKRNGVNLPEDQLYQYMNNGHFCVGINREKLNLHVAYGGRSGRKKYFLPEKCRIKQVALCGNKDSAFGWSWSFQARLEHPPDAAREHTGRVCGWDSWGHRKIDDHIRLGVIADNAGHFYELMIPLAIGANSSRVRREREYCIKQGWQYNKPVTFDDLEALDSQYGLALEACKAQVRKIFEEEKETWPEDARKIMSGIVRMRDTGLRKLRAKLEPIDSVAKATIDDWESEAGQMIKKIRAFEIHVANAKKNAFRRIAAWLQAFDTIAWEGDLSPKRMAEQAGKRKQKRKENYEETGEWIERTPEEKLIESSQKYRQIAGQYQLRQLVKQKHRDRLQNEKAAYSTQTCPECAASVEQTGKLLLVCENGHKRDQDCAASLYFLNRIEGAASIIAEPLEIPVYLRGYLRLMDASEVSLELIEKQ